MSPGIAYIVITESMFDQAIKLLWGIYGTLPFIGLNFAMAGVAGVLVWFSVSLFCSLLFYHP